MTKEQSEDFERYMECVRGLDEDQVSRLAGREYETVQEMYEELKKEMLIKHERDQKRIAELKQQIAAKNEELARKEALKKELESQILLEKQKQKDSKKRGENSCKNQHLLTRNILIIKIFLVPLCYEGNGYTDTEVQDSSRAIPPGEQQDCQPGEGS